MLDHLNRVGLDLIWDHKGKFGAFQQAVLALRERFSPVSLSVD